MDIINILFQLCLLTIGITIVCAFLVVLYKQKIQKNDFEPEDKKSLQEAEEYIQAHIARIESGQVLVELNDEELKNQYADKLKHPIIQMVLQVCHEVDPEDFNPRTILRKIDLKKNGVVNHDNIADALGVIKAYHRHLPNSVEQAILNVIGLNSDLADCQEKIDQVLKEQRALDVENAIQALQEMIKSLYIKDKELEIKKTIQDLNSRKDDIEALSEEYKTIGYDLEQLKIFKKKFEDDGFSKVFVGFYNILNDRIERMENDDVFEVFSDFKFFNTRSSINKEYRGRKSRILDGRCLNELSRNELKALEDLEDAKDDALDNFKKFYF